MENKNQKRPQGRRLGRLKNGNHPCDIWSLPKCSANSKSTGEQCKQPAMKNGKCRFHGGKSTGASKGNQNALKHGYYAAETIRQRKAVRVLLKKTVETMEKISFHNST